MEKELISSIQKASNKPGVYLFKDESGKILYIGKSESLRVRLKNYLNPTDEKTRKLMESAQSVETILTHSDVEALLLEDALVKSNQPRYNVRLRDDKRYPYIKISQNEEFPRIQVVRRVEADRARYFGPYPDAGSVRRVVNLVGEYFGVCKCKKDHSRMKRPCMNHHLGICAGPNAITNKRDYNQLVDQSIRFLSGDNRPVKKSLLKRIKGYSESLDFENALKLKNKLDAIESIEYKQMIEFPKFKSLDVLGFATYDGMSNITNIMVRGGRIQAVLHYPLLGEYRNDPCMSLKTFIKQNYTSRDTIPQMIASSAKPEDHQMLAEMLSEKRGNKVGISVPQKGSKYKLVQMALENSINQIRSQKARRHDPLAMLQSIFRLERIPKRIEGFDISNLGRKDTVASMVCFTNGERDSSNYRLFKIRGGRWDDPGNLAQAVKRRLAHPEWEYPDIILLDGGKAQLSQVAPHVPDSILLLSIAKKEELIYQMRRKAPIELAKDDPALLLLQHVRDESHRFARNFHLKKRAVNFIK